jgi:hypothetical protein
MQQTENDGSCELLMLAITDYNLTGRALIGNYNRTARLRQDVEPAARELDAVDNSRPTVSGFFCSGSSKNLLSGTDGQ